MEQNVRVATTKRVLMMLSLLISFSNLSVEIFFKKAPSLRPPRSLEMAPAYAGKSREEREITLGCQKGFQEDDATG